MLRVVLCFAIFLVGSGLAIADPPTATEPKSGSRSIDPAESKQAGSPKDFEELSQKLNSIEAMLKRLDMKMQKTKEGTGAKTAETDDAGDSPPSPPIIQRSGDDTARRLRKLERDIEKLALAMEKMQEEAATTAELPALSKMPAVVSKAAKAVGENIAGGGHGGLNQQIQDETGHSIKEIGFSLSILLFGVFTITVVIYFVLRHKKEWDVPSVQIIVLILIVIPGAYLITAGYSGQQISPVMGLLGTVAGYMLGQQGPGKGQGLLSQILPGQSQQPANPAPTAPQQQPATQPVENTSPTSTVHTAAPVSVVLNPVGSAPSAQPLERSESPTSTGNASASVGTPAIVRSVSANGPAQNGTSSDKVGLRGDEGAASTPKKD